MGRPPRGGGLHLSLRKRATAWLVRAWGVEAQACLSRPAAAPGPRERPGARSAFGSRAGCSRCLQPTGESRCVDGGAPPSPRGGAKGAALPSLPASACLAGPPQARRERLPRAGWNEQHSWRRTASYTYWDRLQALKRPPELSMPLLTAALWYCRQLYTYLVHLLKWWSRYLQRKFTKNHSVLAEVDLLGYCAEKWKGETERARKMREAYEDLFWRYHIKSIHQVRSDNYCVLRAVLFQIFNQGIPLPPWMKAIDVLKLPEKLLYSQGCNWIQQYSFGPEHYTSSNTLGKLRKCIDTLKNQWMEVSSIKDPYERRNMCNALFGDENMEHQMYEAVKFIMLYQVIEAHECLNNKERIPSFFHHLFMRDTSLDPLSYMINHLNSVGDKRGLDQVDLFLLGYSLEVKIIVYRLSKFNSKEFRVNYMEAYQRDWHEVSLLTDDDQHYHIPVVQI